MITDRKFVLKLIRTGQTWTAERQPSMSTTANSFEVFEIFLLMKVLAGNIKHRFGVPNE